MSTAPTTRPVSPSRSVVPAKKMSLSDITKGGSGLPTRFLLYGTDGVGKSTLAASFPGAIFVMSKGETGVLTLVDNGLIPPVAHFPECATWDDMNSAVKELCEGSHEFKTLVIDTANGGEQLAADRVRERDYNGSAKEFVHYSAGSKNIAAMDWRNFLVELDRLREVKRMTIVLLAHATLSNQRNPDGPDYDKYFPAMSREVRELTDRWADFIGFMDFEAIFADETKARGKAKGGATRLMYTGGCMSNISKNRLGLTDPIFLGSTADEAWQAFSTAIKDAKSKGAK